MQGMIGKKVGMTQVYDENGVHVPVTVIQVGPCVVLQRKNKGRDGYEAVQVGFLDQKESRVSKAQVGHAKKAGTAPKRVVREFPVAKDAATREGDTLTAEVFEGVKYVDVSGTTKGRGFQGVVKRHQMGGGRASHGGQATLRRPGSIGMRTKPGRVFKNKRMAGHMGHVHVTTQNLRVVQVRKDDNAILVEGAVPGPNGGVVVVKKAIKRD